MQPEQLLARIEKLERQNRRMKLFSSVILAAGLAAAAIGEL